VASILSFLKPDDGATMRRGLWAKLSTTHARDSAAQASRRYLLSGKRGAPNSYSPVAPRSDPRTVSAPAIPRYDVGIVVSQSGHSWGGERTGQRQRN
jgi:hypothetical protein